MSGEERTPLDPKAPNRLRIGTCRSYLQWVFEKVGSWTADRQGKDGADLILICIFARSARTYEGIVRCLGESGFGEQGLMLNRSLFEDMVEAHWVSTVRQSVQAVDLEVDRHALGRRGLKLARARLLLPRLERELAIEELCDGFGSAGAAVVDGLRSHGRATLIPAAR